MDPHGGLALGREGEGMGRGARANIGREGGIRIDGTSSQWFANPDARENLGNMKVVATTECGMWRRRVAV